MNLTEQLLGKSRQWRDKTARACCMSVQHRTVKLSLENRTGSGVFGGLDLSHRSSISGKTSQDRMARWTDGGSGAQ
ncbi:hypothetical protein PanWU01x14_099660 [Parasponia andersonii]|uniref:Uncharacterized protein n=1 Tax=Parasponia andersonii TaxID=3476 RepID=A0A2P5D3E4_PARAD|nr:hypothetical protein PanWU01x14_099660 [Parasponia andersonii]